MVPHFKKALTSPPRLNVNQCYYIQVHQYVSTQDNRADLKF